MADYTEKIQKYAETVADATMHKLRVGDMVIFIYRKQRKVRLRVSDLRPDRSSSQVIDVDCDNPKECSAEVFVSVLDAFWESYKQICSEYWRAMRFYGNSICPIISRLLEINGVTKAALQK